MELLIRSLLSKYNDYLAEAKVCEKWLATHDDTQRARELEVLQMKLTFIRSWFELLNSDETFVIEKHLIDGLEWARVADLFEAKWEKHSRTIRTLVKYQNHAIAKIQAFSQRNLDIVQDLFGEDAMAIVLAQQEAQP